MSVEQRMVVDAIGTTLSGRCQLTIFDHLPWDDPKHLQMLQDKINDYLDFIQSGQLFESRPDARGRALGTIFLSFAIDVGRPFRLYCGMLSDSHHLFRRQLNFG
jgi:hypothetical protein